MSSDQAVRRKAVETVVSDLVDMDPSTLMPFVRTGITVAERARAERPWLTGELASQDYRDRQLLEVWSVLIHRKWDHVGTWQELFDDLLPGGPERLRELYDALPDPAREEFDRRYGRPDLAGA